MAIYREHYRPMGAEDNLNAVLDNTGAEIVGIALHRGGPEFSEHERLLLDLLRPHLTQAWHNAKAVTRMQQESTLARHIVEVLDRGVVALTREGSVLLMNTRARQWLEDYFGRRSLLGNHLPEILERWVRHEEDLLEEKDNVPPPRKPLFVERGDKRLVVRHMCEQTQCLLLFEEQQTAPQPAALESLGLTNREAEVLHWVAQGKTDAEIGTILGVSPRTVQKHLEQIYQKLGVENRTAAAAKAYEIASITPTPATSPGS
jgi:DNA-binding CsgD family transcriptional regulator